MEKDEIIIRNAIVHILDSSVGMPVLSDTVLELGPDLNDFLRSHIFKIATSDDTKSCDFDEETSAVYHMLKNFSEEDMIEVSKKTAEHLYSIMNQNIDIPPADLLFVTYQANSCMFLALLKMNYKETYIHYTGSGEGYGNCNDIIKQKATLPSDSTKLSEAALINLSNYSINLVEKKYDINGTKTNYFSQMFLQCRAKLSPKAKLNIVTKAVEQINNKYFEEDFDKKMEAKSILHNEYEKEGYIHIESIREKLFSDSPEIKEEFTEKLEKYHIQSDKVIPQNKQTTKKFEKQFLTTDTGIEINIPMEQYNNREHIEFITNTDGTISVLIKNINHLSAK